MSLAPEVIEKLAAPLDPTRVKKREGGGGRSLSYLESHDVIRTANEVFGIGGWSYHVHDLTHLGTEKFIGRDAREGHRTAYRATVAVNVGDSAHYSDVGYGDATEYTNSTLTTHELAAKEAVSDAVKRALRNLGDQFGLCLYDKHAPEHNGRNASAPRSGASPSTAPSSGGSGGGGREAVTAPSPTPEPPASPQFTPPAPKPTMSPGGSPNPPTDKQLGFLKKLMHANGATEADLGTTFDRLTKQEASVFIEQFKSGTFNPASLAAEGAGFEDDDPDGGIPF